MTRKRFIKLLMAHGYQRDFAHYVAWEAWENYESYEDAWEHRYKIQAMAYSIGMTVERAAKAVYNTFSDILAKIGISMADAKSAMKEMYTKPSDCFEEGEYPDEVPSDPLFW